MSNFPLARIPNYPLMTSKLSDLYTVKIQKKKLRRGLKVMLV